MKRKLLHMAVLVGMIILASNNVTAQIITTFSPSTHGVKQQNLLQTPQILDKHKYDVKEQGNFRTYIPKKKRMKAEEEKKVTILFDYDETKYIPGAAMIYNKELTMESWEIQENNYIFSAPTGVYDLLVDFWLFAADGMDVDGMGGIIREQVSITKDTTIIIKPEEATNHIEVVTYTLDGEKAKMPVVKIAEDHRSYEIIDEGNLDDIAFSRYIFLKDYGTVSIFYGNFGWTIWTEEGLNCGEQKADFYLNDVSDRYVLAESRVAHKDGICYISKYQVEGTSKKILQNDPNNYILYREDFQTTPLGEQTEKGHTQGYGSIDLFNNIQVGGFNGSFYNNILTENSTTIYIDAPKEEPGDENQFNIMLYPTFGDYRNVLVEIWDEDGEVVKDTTIYYSNIIGLPAFISKKGIEYVNKGHDAYGNYSFQIPEDGDILEYPGHSVFSYTDKEKMGIYGNSCPINAFMAQSSVNDYFGWKYSYLSPCYIGRLGEIRMSDERTLDMSLKYNGIEIETDYNRLDSLMQAWATEKHPDGNVELMLTNKNVKVDDVAGKNVTSIHYDQTKEDWTAPTLQMLHFKNTNGLITDRFVTAEEGILEFSGGDFNFKDKEERTYFDCQPQTVAVSYAPYGKDTWQTLPVDEVPDLYRMPGFGYFYRGSLASVTEQSENGWYDLKITLTDLSGNQQTQTISPAFKIGEGSGISSATVEDISIYTHDGLLHVKTDKKVSLSLFTIAGTQVCTVANAPVSIAGLSAGVYIAKITDEAGNVSLHKVRVK